VRFVRFVRRPLIIDECEALSATVRQVAHRAQSMDTRTLSGDGCSVRWTRHNRPRKLALRFQLPTHRWQQQLPLPAQGMHSATDVNRTWQPVEVFAVCALLTVHSTTLLMSERDAI
jgi:hypothetical protein